MEGSREGKVRRGETKRGVGGGRGALNSGCRFPRQEAPTRVPNPRASSIQLPRLFLAGKVGEGRVRSILWAVGWLFRRRESWFTDSKTEVLQNSPALLRFTEFDFKPLKVVNKLPSYVQRR